MSTLLDIGSLDRYDDDSMPDLVMMAYWSGTSVIDGWMDGWMCHV